MKRKERNEKKKKFTVFGFLENSIIINLISISFASVLAAAGSFFLQYPFFSLPSSTNVPKCRFVLTLFKIPRKEKKKKIRDRNQRLRKKEICFVNGICSF